MEPNWLGGLRTRINWSLQSVPLLAVVPASAYVVHEWSVLPRLWPLGWLALFVVLLAWWRRSRWLRAVALATISVLVTVAVAQAGLARQLTDSMQGVDYTVMGRITSLVTRFEHGRSFRFLIVRCELADGPCPVDRTVRLSWYGKPPHTVKPGQHWRINIRLKRIHSQLNPGGFDSELRALQTGLDGAGYVRSKRKRDTIKSWREPELLGYQWSVLSLISATRDATQRTMHDALSRFTEQTRGTLVALVTGNQNAIPPPTWEVYNRTGTSHLMSISGLHVTMFAALAIALTRRLLRIRFIPIGLLNRFSAPVLAWSLGLLAALAYSAFSGWGIPAQRTTLMLAVAGVVVISGRCVGVVTILAWVAAAVTVFDPWAVRSAGFWLSFGAVAAIIAASQGWVSPRKSWLKDAARTQWAATLVLVPLGAVWFGSVSVISPLANALAIPVVAGVLTPAAMVGGLLAGIFPLIGVPVLWVTAWLTHLLLWGLTQCSTLDGAIWITGTPTFLALGLAALGVLCLLRPVMRLPTSAGIALIVPVLIAPPIQIKHGNWSLIAADVGQGSALIIQTAHHALLFDTGPTYGKQSGAGNRIIAPLLRAKRIRMLDKIVISHRDTDHTGGASVLLRRFGAPTMLSSVALSHPLRSVASASQDCERGLKWQWDGVQFEFLHPGPAFVSTARPKTNARSCVLRVRSSAGSALLTGDIERAQEAQLLQIYSAAQLQTDVLIAPHHGSATSSSNEFIDTVNPQWVVFQAGFRNRFRHPADRVLKRYTDRAIEILRTDLHGAIIVDFSDAQPTRVVRYREHRPRYWRTK